MFKKYQQIHFVGIGGVGMSGIAEVLLTLGYRVTGSDMKRGETIERLERLGAKVFSGHEPANLEGAHVVVYSAVARDNVEVQVARQRGISDPAGRDAGRLMRLKCSIAIAGTHDKTTTTSMVAAVLGRGLRPRWSWAGACRLGANAQLGQGEFLVAEAARSAPSSCLHRRRRHDQDAEHRITTRPDASGGLLPVNKVPIGGGALSRWPTSADGPAVEKRVVTYRLSRAPTSRRGGTCSRGSPQFEVVYRSASRRPRPGARAPQRPQRWRPWR